MPQDFDLNLNSLWYSKTPPAFPVLSMKAKGPCTSTYSWSWEQDFSGTRKILICAVRWTDTLATTVGDGECWTLIHQALVDLADTYRQYGEEAPRISQGRNHGHCILTLAAPTPGSNTGLLQLADVRPGDILEMRSAHFKIIEEPPAVPDVTQQEQGGWQKGPREKNIRLAHHTAIVARLDGDVVNVVEQNGSIPMGVGLASYHLEQMVRGEIEIFRVIGESWCGNLEATWDEDQ